MDGKEAVTDFSNTQAVIWEENATLAICKIPDEMFWEAVIRDKHGEIVTIQTTGYDSLLVELEEFCTEWLEEQDESK